MSAPRVRRRPFWRRLVAPVVVLVALNQLVFAAYTLPRSFQVRNVVARAAEVRQELERERAATAVLRTRAEIIHGNAADAGRFYQEMVVKSRADLIPLLEDVEKMATEPGLKTGIRGYKLDEVTGAPLTRVAITLVLEGSYDQLVAFLDQVERSPRFLTIDRIGMTAGSAGGPASLRVELSAYIAGKPEAAGKERRRG